MNLSATARWGCLLIAILFLTIKGNAQYLSIQEIIDLHVSTIKEATDFFEPNGWDFLEKNIDTSTSNTSYLWANTYTKSTEIALAWFSFVYNDKKKMYSQYQMQNKEHYITMLNEMKSLQFELIQTYIHDQTQCIVYRNSFYTILISKKITETTDNSLNCFRVYKNLIYNSLH